VTGVSVGGRAAAPEQAASATRPASPNEAWIDARRANTVGPTLLALSVRGPHSSVGNVGYSHLAKRLLAAGRVLPACECLHLHDLPICERHDRLIHQAELVAFEALTQIRLQLQASDNSNLVRVLTDCHLLTDC